MHESSLAKRILDAVIGRALAAEARRIRVVRGWIAETEALSPESLGLHFAAHAKGTTAEDARLELRLVRVDARCIACAMVYAPDHHLLLCPSCGSPEGELLGATGIGIDSLDVD